MCGDRNEEYASRPAIQQPNSMQYIYRETNWRSKNKAWMMNHIHHTRHGPKNHCQTKTEKPNRNISISFFILNFIVISRPYKIIVCNWFLAYYKWIVAVGLVVVGDGQHTHTFIDREKKNVPSVLRFRTRTRNIQSNTLFRLCLGYKPYASPANRQYEYKRKMIHQYNNNTKKAIWCARLIW